MDNQTSPSVARAKFPRIVLAKYDLHLPTKLIVLPLCLESQKSAAKAQQYALETVPEPGTITGLIVFGLSALGIKRKQKKG